MLKIRQVLLGLLLVVVSVANAQSKQITGQVISESDGEPIPGVSVLVVEEGGGTITDVEGNYSVSVPNNETTLRFSFIGMESKDVVVGDATTLNVQLASGALQMDEIVVTALGIKRETKALGYAVQSVKSEELKKTGNPDLAKALQGKVAGIDIKSSSGMPGASSQITIRGARSFTGNNSPLYIIDGMPISSNPSVGTGDGVTGSDYSNRALDINPNEIETISVLKGQTAAALYGLRASNGVIIITTKNGSGLQKGKPVVSINHTTSFENVSRTPDYQTTWSQGNGGSYSPGTSMSWGAKITDLPNDPTYGGNGNGHEGMYKVPQLEEAGLDPWVTPSVYNNWDDYYQTGISNSTNLNVAQATEKGNFAIGLGYTDQSGIALNTGLNKFNAKAAADSELTKNFKVGFSANYIQSDIDKLSGANDASLAGVLSAPSSYNLKGIPNHVPGDPYDQIYYRSLTFDNPYWIPENNTFNEKNNRFFGSSYVQYMATLSDDMKLNVKYQLGIDASNSHYQDIFGYGSKGKEGEMENHGITNTTTNSLLTVAYDWDINTDLKLNVIVGNEINDEQYKSYYEYGNGFNFGGWNHISNAKTQTASESQYLYRTVGTFGSLSLSWKEMLYFNMTGRNDIASTMPRGNRSFFYPSASLGFVASELQPLKDQSWLTFAKLRLSYAQVGQAGSYKNNYYDTPGYGGGFWTTDPITYPMGGVSSYTLYGTMYDPNLSPQNTESYEIGIDLKFLENRIGFDYTYSRQNVSDQIFSVPLAGSTGASSLVMNGGSLHTNSHEVMLYLVPVRTNDLVWDINLNYSHLDNMVDELADGVESIFLGGFTTPQVRAGIGNTYPVIYGGQFKKNDEGQILVDEDPTSPFYGMPMAGEPGIIGEVSPDFILGGSTSLSYKKATLSATFDWKQGGNMYSGSNGLLDLYGMSKRTEDRESTFIYDGYKADGTPNDIVRGGVNDTEAIKTLYSDVLGNIDEHYIHGNSFVKLRELSLSYNFGKDVIDIMDISMSVFARNILIWTELENFDPESYQGNDNMAGGFERFSLPQASSYGFSINLTF